MGELEGLLFATATPISDHDTWAAIHCNIPTASPTWANVQQFEPYAPNIPSRVRTDDEIRREEKEVTERMIRSGEQVGKKLAEKERLQVSYESEFASLSRTQMKKIMLMLQIKLHNIR